MNNLPTLYKESLFAKVKKAILRFFKKEPEIQLDIKPNNTVKIEEIVQPKNIKIVKEKNIEENKRGVSLEHEEEERE